MLSSKLFKLTAILLISLSLVLGCGGGGGSDSDGDSGGGGVDAVIETVCGILFGGALHNPISTDKGVRVSVNATSPDTVTITFQEGSDAGGQQAVKLQSISADDTLEVVRQYGIAVINQQTAAGTQIYIPCPSSLRKRYNAPHHTMLHEEVSQRARSNKTRVAA